METSIRVTLEDNDSLPAVTAAVLAGSSLVLTFDKALDKNSVPATSAFGVTVTDSGNNAIATTVSGVSVSGQTVTLTISPAVTSADDVVKVSYTVPGSKPLQDTDGNDVASFTDREVDNQPEPELALSVSSDTIAEAAGTSTVTVAITNGVTFDADQTITLTLGGTATVTDDYTIVSQSLTLMASETSVTTTVTAVQDTTDEPDETVIITATHDSTEIGSQTITITDDDNTPATGTVAITGETVVGDELTAALSGVTDEDGYTDSNSDNVPDALTWQWVRVDSGTGTDIPGATAQTYTLVAADAGKTIRVKASFTDGAGTTETLTNSTAVGPVTVNTPPTASNRTININEDGSHTFVASNFGYSDADSDPLASVKIVTLPDQNHGALTLSNFAVTANDVIMAANIGNLVFTPAADWNGSASFTFTVNDGRADSTATYTMTINVDPVPDVVDTDGVAVTSTPKSGTADPKDTYARTETIRITVTFDEAVTVDTSGGTPFLQIMMGSATADAPYVSGSGMTELVFEYTVVAADTDSDGISVASNALMLNGGTIQDGDSNTADITLGTLGNQSGHKVDGSLDPPDTTAPTFSRALVTATAPKSLVITFSEALDTTSVPDGSAFAVIVGTTPEGTPTNVSISGAEVTLTLAKALDASQSNVTVDYTNPGSANSPLKDAADNEVATFTTSQSVTNNAPACPTGQPAGAYWTACLTVGNSGSNYGYRPDPSGYGALSSTIFTEGNQFTVGQLSQDSAKFYLTLATSDLNVAEYWVLQVGGETLNLADATLTGARYEWTLPAALAWDDDNIGDKISVSLTQGNRPPTASNAEVDMDEDATYTFSVADFGYSDEDNDDLASVKIVTLETAGDLELSGTDVTANDVISVADITAGNLVFTPAADWNGSASFTFTVNDGEDDSDSANPATMTINVDPVPDVTQVAVTSTPNSGTADTYGPGEVIEVTVTFDEAVTVNTSGGAPYFEIRVGGPDPAVTRRAEFLRMSDTNALVFGYTVVAADRDNNGIWIEADALKLNSGTIQSVAHSNNADITHAQLGTQSDHQVDGGLNAPATGLVMTGTPSVGQTLTADVSGISDANGLTSPSYTYQWKRWDDQTGTTSVDVGTDSSTYTPVIADAGQYIAVTVSFDDDASNSEELTAVTANTVSSLPARNISLSQGSYTVEEGNNLTVTVEIRDDNGALATLEKDVTLRLTSISGGNANAGVDFVEVNEAVTIDMGDMSADVTVVTLDDELAESAEDFRLQLAWEGGAPVFTQNVVTLADTVFPVTIEDDGDTLPVVARAYVAAVQPDEVVLIFDRALDTGSVPAATAFAVKVDGSAGPGVTAVAFDSTDATKVRLTLATEVYAAQTSVTVDYTNPGTSNSPLRDTAVRRAMRSQSFTDQTVVSTPPAALVFTGAPVSVTEGRQATYTVALDAAPVADVTVSLTLSGDTGAATISPASLTFTPTDWGAKTVTVTGVDDGVEDDDRAVTITHSGTGVTTGTVSVTVSDIPPSALVFTPETVTVTEGRQARYTVALDAAPVADVTVSLTLSGDTGAATVSPASLTFTPTDWGAKTVTVTGVDDGVEDDDRTVTITHSGDGVTTGTVSVTVTDVPPQSDLEAPRKEEATTLLRRYADRFASVSSGAALGRLQGLAPPTTVNAQISARNHKLDASWTGEGAKGSGWAGWSRLFYGWVEGPGDGAVYDLYLGVDWRAPDGRYVIGGMLGHEGANLRLDDGGGRFRSRITQVGLYGATYLSETLILDGALAYGFGRPELSQGGVTAKYDTRRLTLRADLTGGLSWRDGAMVIEPQLGVLHVQEKLGAFADSAGVVGTAETLRLTRLGIGPRLTWMLPRGTFTGRARLNWDRHNLDNEQASDLSASLDARLRYDLDGGLSAEFFGAADGIGLSGDQQTYSAGVSLNFRF